MGEICGTPLQSKFGARTGVAYHPKEWFVQATMTNTQIEAKVKTFILGANVGNWCRQGGWHNHELPIFG